MPIRVAWASSLIPMFKLAVCTRCSTDRFGHNYAWPNLFSFPALSEFDVWLSRVWSIDHFPRISRHHTWLMLLRPRDTILTHASLWFLGLSRYTLCSFTFPYFHDDRQHVNFARSNNKPCVVVILLLYRNWIDPMSTQCHVRCINFILIIKSMY
jgi:hypothetical protein